MATVSVNSAAVNIWFVKDANTVTYVTCVTCVTYVAFRNGQLFTAVLRHLALVVKAPG